MAVVALQSLADLSKFTTKPTDISIVKAEASWCSPCHAIAPVFEKVQHLTSARRTPADEGRILQLAKEYSGRVQVRKSGRYPGGLCTILIHLLHTFSSSRWT